MFAEFAHKIIHVVVDDTPPGYTHDRDTFQKNAVGRGLKGCTDEDIILFSDLDEIPNPEKVKEILRNFDPTKIYHFAQRMFYCYLNMEEVSGNLLSYAGEFPGVTKKQWIGSKMCSFRLLREQNLKLGRASFPGAQGDRYPRIRRRLAFRLHGRPRRKEREEAGGRKGEIRRPSGIQQGGNPLRRGGQYQGRKGYLRKDTPSFRLVEIDDTYPEYLRNHLSEYDFLILKKEGGAHRALRHAKSWLRKNYYRAGRGVKRVCRKLTGKG